MITLNLLPPPLKAALRRRAIYAALEQVMIAAFGLLLTACVLLLLVRIRLLRVLNDVQGRQILSAEYLSVNKDIRALNAQIGRIELLQKMQISPTALLLDIGQRTPEGVRLSSIDFDVSSESLRLSGRAQRREDLLAYESAIKASPFVKSLDSPISNLFQKSDINFQFKIVLNVQALKDVFNHAP
ncbi:MAG: PilN domain-containing protein [Patescibacteria group bacterium]|nr:MAG: PilN domain-containing protein [Patescibacteria group bacterium]